MQYLDKFASKSVCIVEVGQAAGGLVNGRARTGRLRKDCNILLTSWLILP